VPSEIRSLAELPRFVADATGLGQHPWDRDAAAVAVAQFDPPGDDEDRKAGAVEEWGAGREALEALSTKLDAAIGDGRKLLRRGDELLLYDLAGDPLEERPRPVTRDEAPADLLGAIESQPAGPLVAPSSGSATEDVSAEELARIEDQMRTLGYL
jgi:hypothetical protein